MLRRGFLKKSTLAGFIFPFFSPFGFNIGKSHRSYEQNLSVTQFFELNECTIEQLQNYMQKGHYSARILTQHYLERIHSIDKNGPKLNAIIEINPDALHIADILDKERKNGRVRGKLHGIPILIKDNIDTGDSMQTTAGSLAMEGHIASRDAFIVQKLRQAGAVLLGKTNLSEWANFRSTRSSSGWSSRGGQTNNPYKKGRNPCGSSSGSGVAVASNLCVVAIGTETDGSIVCPSSVNAIVGIKPTVGLWSRTGIIPISHTQDTAGPMARTVKDAAILLGILAGEDPLDPVTDNHKNKIFTDYAQFCNPDSLQGKRLGIEKALLKGHEGVDALLEQSISVLKNKGAEVVEVELLNKMKELGNGETLVLQYEFKSDLNKYLSTANARVKSLKEVIDYNKQHESEIMPYFKQETLESAEARGDLTTKEYVDALHKNLTVSRNAIDNILKDQQLDAIIGPTTGPTWCTDLINGDHFNGYETSTPAAVAGYPHITVPMGTVQGLPVGISFLGAAFSEGLLISMAYAYEQASLHRRPPVFN